MTIGLLIMAISTGLVLILDTKLMKYPIIATAIGIILFTIGLIQYK